MFLAWRLWHKWVSGSCLVAAEGCAVPFPNQPWQGSVGATSCGPVSWSLDLLTARMARFLLQEINSVKVTSWWGRGKGKSYHKIVLPNSEKFL